MPLCGNAMPKTSEARLGDVSALVRASSTLGIPSIGDGLSRKRRLVAMFCSFLGEQVLEGKSPALGDSPLSRRQRETLELLLAGNAEKQIAAQLSISRHTVHVYVKSLYKRFGVNSRPELLAKWVRK
jgi:DNA-binding CsgD family transcriptional regulator